MSDLQGRTRWEPAEAESAIFERWLESGLFHPEPEGPADQSFSIAIPPPNVTGALHMGHALNGSVQDCLVRYHRMLGRRTKWILGTDHAGIATQTQVEKLLRSEGTTREAVGRDRKSTRLNSSHVAISYAVFCLKKKKKQQYNSPSIHNKLKSTMHTP